jgi:hypothetical protein
MINNRFAAASPDEGRRTRHLWFPERGMILAFVALVLSHLQLSIAPVVGMKALRPPLLFPYLIGAFADEVKSLHRRCHRLIFGRELRDSLQGSAVVDPRGQSSKTLCLLSKIARALLHHRTPTTRLNAVPAFPVWDERRRESSVATDQVRKQNCNSATHYRHYCG